MSSLEMALNVLETEVSGWGKRDAYPIMREDMEILIEAQAEVIVLNKDNKDGTFFTQVKFNGLIFESSTAVHVKTPSTQTK